MTERLLNQAREALLQRASHRDTPDGERSMRRTVDIFNAITGHRLSTLEGWKFMIALKLARSSQGGFHPDDYVDLIGYSALAGECAADSIDHSPV